MSKAVKIMGKPGVEWKIVSLTLCFHLVFRIPRLWLEVGEEIEAALDCVHRHRDFHCLMLTGCGSLVIQSSVSSEDICNTSIKSDLTVLRHQPCFL